MVKWAPNVYKKDFRLRAVEKVFVRLDKSQMTIVLFLCQKRRAKKSRLFFQSWDHSLSSNV